MNFLIESKGLKKWGKPKLEQKPCSWVEYSQDDLRSVFTNPSKIDHSKRPSQNHGTQKPQNRQRENKNKIELIFGAILID